jgi:uncharacterized protein YbjT (DUF2867 family)
LIVLTGASGNVGTEVLKRLASTGQPVRVAAHHPSATWAGHVEVVPFAFEDPATHAAALRGANALFLLRPRGPSDVTPLVDAAVQAGVQRVVFLSVSGAASNPHVPHRMVEQRIEATPLVWTFLRANFFMQNLSTVHRADIRERDDVFVPAGDGKVAYIDVRDIADAAVAALTADDHACTAYELTGPDALDHAEVA